VINQRLISGVVYYVGYVLRRRPHVEGVKDGAPPGDGPVRLEAPDGVSVERGYPVAGAHAHLPQPSASLSVLSHSSAYVERMLLP